MLLSNYSIVIAITIMITTIIIIVLLIHIHHVLVIITAIAAILIIMLVTRFTVDGRWAGGGQGACPEFEIRKTSFGFPRNLPPNLPKLIFWLPCRSPTKDIIGQKGPLSPCKGLVGTRRICSSICSDEHSF